MRIFTFSIITLIAVLTAIYVNAQTVVSDGFENWNDPNHPTMWFGVKTSFTSTSVTQYTSNVHSGTYAVQLTNATTSHKRFTSQPVSVTTGTTYTVTYWVRGHGEVRIGLFDNRTVQSGYWYRPYTTVNSSSWAQITDTIICINSYSTAEFIFSIRNTVADIDHLQIDDVTINGPNGPSPVLTITSPSYNQVVYSPDVNVSFAVANFVVANGTGDGHVHYKVDGGAVNMVYDTNPIALTGLTHGSHMVVLELVDNAHNSLSPAVKDSVNIIVNLSTPLVKTIYQIQYTTATPANSPYLDSLVTTSGIVTGTCASGFFIQDGAGPWNGIFVLNNTYTVNRGDNVTLTGLVYEYYEYTEIKSLASLTVNSSGNTEPAASVVTSSGVKSELYESVLVQIKNAKCVNTNSGFGMWTVNDGTTAGDTCKIHNLLYTMTPTLNFVYDITGPDYYSFSEFRVEPRSAADVTISGMEDNYTLEANIYPNPATSFISISAKESLAAVTIYDIQGRVVLQQLSLGSSEIKLNVSDFSKGMYNIVAVSVNGNTFSSKLLK